MLNDKISSTEVKQIKRIISISEFDNFELENSIYSDQNINDKEIGKCEFDLYYQLFDIESRFY